MLSLNSVPTRFDAGRPLDFGEPLIRRNGYRLPTVFSRIAQEIEIVLSPVILVEQDLSIFPLHN